MEDHFVQIGTRHVWGGAQPIGLSRADRRQHAYVIGKTMGRVGKESFGNPIRLLRPPQSTRPATLSDGVIGSAIEDSLTNNSIAQDSRLG